MKIFLFMTALLFLTTIQRVFSDPGIVAKARDIPYRVPLVNTPVKVDAVLDEYVWEKAVKIDANIEVQPGENIPAPVRTEVRIAYDRENLYVAIIAYDPDPSQIRAHISDRDNIGGDDWVLILFDTFNDQQRTYDFMCNPLGVQRDFIETPNGNGEYDVIWDSHGRITGEGYIVEMAIPFSSIPFQNTEGDQIWGFDIVRSYPRNVRHHIGAFPRDRSNNCYMCQALKLIGFAGVKPGKNLELDPTFSTRLTQEREDETSGPFKEKDRALDPGITARWGVTPNITLSATANPDFSQVEADVAQMDINTQFALYYPEKRPFFLEGADFFGTSLRAVHTRMLAEPEWGTKITGKEGRNTIGFFTVRDNMTNMLFPGTEDSDNTSLSMQTSGSVLRYKRDVGKSSNVGILLTDREGNHYHNRLGGIDGDLKLTQTDQIRFQLLGSKTRYPDQVLDEFEQPGGNFGGTAFDFDYMHMTRNIVWVGRYRDVSPDFRADLGFITQSGFRNMEAAFGYFWNKDPGHWYTRIFAAYGGGMDTDYYDNMLKKTMIFQLQYEGPIQSFVNLNAVIGKKSYEGVEFDERVVHFFVNIRPTGSLFLSLSGNAGDQIDYDNTRAGKQIKLTPTVEYKFGQRLTLSLNHAFERLTVDPGRLYTVNVSNFKTTYQFNRRTFLRTILQSVHYDHNIRLYDDDDIDPENKSLFSQILFSYKINPQTVFFLGYSDNYSGDQDTILTQTNRTVFTKIGYAWML